MKRYIVYRLLQGVVLLCLVATIVFFLGRLTGNPADLMLPEDATAEDRLAMIKALGLDGSLHEQFFIFVKNALHGDLGMSIRMRQPAVEAFFDRLPNTLVIVPWALLLGMSFGIPLGVIAALNRGNSARPGRRNCRRARHRDAEFLARYPVDLRLQRRAGLASVRPDGRPRAFRPASHSRSARS